MLSKSWHNIPPSANCGYKLTTLCLYQTSLGCLCPLDEYSTDSTIQAGIITPPAHPLDSTTSSTNQLDLTMGPDEVNTSSKDVTNTSISMQDVTLYKHNGEPNMLVFQAGNLEEVDPINITLQEVTSDSNTLNTSLTTPDTDDVHEVSTVSTDNRVSAPASATSNLDANVSSSTDGMQTTSQDLAVQPDPPIGFTGYNQYKKNSFAGCNICYITDLQNATAQSQPDSKDVTDTNPVTKRCKEHLHSLGLSDSVYSSNSDIFYPALSPEQDEVDYISFKDIIDTTWSIPLDNLSSNDIELEQAYLKSHITSSPKPPSNYASNSLSSTEILKSPSDSEKDDPTYGRMKKPKPSMRPGRRHSSACIAAQKLILKTKGSHPRSAPTTQNKIIPPAAGTSTSMQIPGSSSWTTSTKVPDDIKSNPSSINIPVKSPPKCFGLKITHHGIVCQPAVKKGRLCTCEMCGGKVQK